MKPILRLFSLLAGVIVCCSILSGCVLDDIYNTAHIAGYKCSVITSVSGVTFPEGTDTYENLYWTEGAARHIIVSEWTDKGPEGVAQVHLGHAGGYSWESDNDKTNPTPTTHSITNDGTHFYFDFKYFRQTDGWVIADLRENKMLLVSSTHQKYIILYKQEYVEEETERVKVYDVNTVGL